MNPLLSLLKSALIVLAAVVSVPLLRIPDFIFVL